MQANGFDMQMNPQGTADFTINRKNPFDPLFKASPQQLRAAVELQVIRMAAELDRDYREGYQSNNSRRNRKAKEQEVGGGYFGNMTNWGLLTNSNKGIPIGFVSNIAPNALRFEASHGNMRRLLDRFAGGAS